MRKRSYQGGIFLTRIETSRFNLPIEDEDEHDDERRFGRGLPRYGILLKNLSSRPFVEELQFIL
jgi:hypothetical protein